MYDVILANGDRAEAETLSAALLAANTLRRDAVEHGANARIARKTIVAQDGQYDPVATRMAHDGLACSFSDEWSQR